MRRFIFVLLTTAMAVSLNAYSDTPGKNAKDAKVTKKCLFPKSRKLAPDWICNEQADNLVVAAVGSFAKSAAGTEFMQQMAAADARVHLAKKLHDPIMKKFMESEDAAVKTSAARDSAVIRKITDEQLEGSKILKSVYGPKGTLYILIGFDEAGVQRLNESITEKYMKQMRQTE